MTNTQVFIEVLTSIRFKFMQDGIPLTVRDGALFNSATKLLHPDELLSVNLEPG